MWKDIRDNNFGIIEKFISEYNVATVGILPSISMKVKVYERIDGGFIADTKAAIRRKFDDSFEGAMGYGNTEEEALQNSLKYFYKMIEEEYPERDETGLDEKDVKFKSWNEF